MIYTIIGFETEDFEKFSAAVNSLKPDEKMTIFIDTDGGSVVVRDMYADVINRLPNVEVIACIIISSGFNLFRDVQCTKRILPTAYGMVHQEAWGITMCPQMVPRGSFERFKKQFKEKIQPEIHEWMTPEEKEIYLIGDEVWLDYDRLIEIFPELGTI